MYFQRFIKNSFFFFFSLFQLALEFHSQYLHTKCDRYIWNVLHFSERLKTNLTWFFFIRH